MLAVKLPYGSRRLASPDPSWIELDVNAPSGHTPGQPSSTGTGADYVWTSQPSAYGTFQFGDGLLLTDSMWWDFDTATGGLWDFQFWYVTGYDCGIISVRIDGREIGQVDMYSGPDTTDVVFNATGIPIGAGKHRLSLHPIGANASAHGQPGEWIPYFYYWTIERLLLRRTRVLPGLIARPPRSLMGGPHRQQVDVDVFFSSGSASWSTLNVDHQTEGSQMLSSAVLGATRWWYYDLAAGEWEVEVLYGEDTNHGIFAILIDDVEVGRIDGYASPVSNALRVRGTANVKAVLRASIPTSGRHKISATIVDVNGSSSNWYSGLRRITLRQIRPRPATAQGLHPGVVNFDVLWSHGNVGWSSYNLASSQIHGFYLLSSGTIHDQIWWYDYLPRGAYDAELIHQTLSSYGIVTLSVDDVAVGTVDTYAASGVNNARDSMTGIVVPVSGRHKISLSVDDKNPSSSGYAAAVVGLQLRKTSNDPVVITASLTQIPLMVSNNSPVGVASATSELTGGGYEAYCAMNPTAGAANGWLDNGSSLPVFIAYRFPSPVTILHYQLRPWWFNVFPGRSPSSWTFEGSSDGGATWTTLDTVTGHSWGGDSTSVITFAVGSPGLYADYRLHITANGGDTYTGLGSIQMTTA